MYGGMKMAARLAGALAPLAEAIRAAWALALPLLRTAAWRPQARAGNGRMVLVVDMAPDGAFPQLWRSLGRFIEEHARVRVVVANFRTVTRAGVEALSPHAVVLTGFHQELSRFDWREMEGLFELLRRGTTPIFAICGGMEILCKAFGAEVVPLINPERGFVDVTLHAADPVLDGLPQAIRVFEWHGLHVPRLPEGFELLGGNESCPVQIVRRSRRPVYGVQFHPEFSVRGRDGGARVLLNFLGQSGLEVSA